MAVGAFLEPLIVVSLLFGGAYFNRNKDYSIRAGKSLTSWVPGHANKKSDDLAPYSPQQRSSSESWSSSSTPTLASYELPELRRRKIQFLGFNRTVETPNTALFKDRFLSRLLQKFPFLVEAWYWALIYWVW